MSRILLAILFSTVTFVAAIASRPFNGHLYDYKGNPIKNAKVYVLNRTGKYIKTNKDGKFTLENVKPNDTILVKWKGRVYDIPVDGNRGISVKFDREPLNNNGDYVDTGKGIIRARDYNGPRSVMNAKQLEATGQSDLVLAMQSMPGVFVSYKNGSNQPSISIRNYGSPLWIVDGVEMTSFPGLTVMEVERVEVLKDGAMYGTRGAGGVIIVTTKGSSF